MRQIWLGAVEKIKRSQDSNSSLDEPFLIAHGVVTNNSKLSVSGSEFNFSKQSCLQNLTLNQWDPPEGLPESVKYWAKLIQ